MVSFLLKRRTGHLMRVSTGFKAERPRVMSHVTLGAMLHRHLDHQRFTRAAIDDIIVRGKRADWEELRAALLDDPNLGQKILEICQSNLQSPSSRRYCFWMTYVQTR